MQNKIDDFLTMVNSVHLQVSSHIFDESVYHDDENLITDYRRAYVDICNINMFFDDEIEDNISGKLRCLRSYESAVIYGCNMKSDGKADIVTSLEKLNNAMIAIISSEVSDLKIDKDVREFGKKC